MVKEVDVGSSSTTRFMSKSQLRKVAREELNETVKNRKLALTDLREWIDQQESEKYACLLDAKDEFLLRFLRMQKMDVQKAAKVLDNYVGFRTDNPEWFDNLDINKDTQLNDVISSGYLFVLPGRDVNGRRVVFSRACCSDSSRFSSADIMRAHLITYEALLLEEECQINGKSSKFKSRIKVKEFFPVDDLPKEYGGIVPMADMIDSWKSELEKRREKIQSLDSVRYYSNCSGSSDDDLSVS